MYKIESGNGTSHARPLTSYDVYISYLALQRHFQDKSYDFFKYNGKVNTSPKAFENRRDKYFFQKIKNKEDPFGFLLSYISLHPKNCWIKDIYYNGDKVFLKWQKYFEGLEYHFKNDIEKIDFRNDLVVRKNKFPKIIQKIENQEINKETLLILNYFMGIINYWEKRIDDEFLWPDISLNLKKYAPFVISRIQNIDRFAPMIKKKMQEIIHNK